MKLTYPQSADGWSVIVGLQHVPWELPPAWRLWSLMGRSPCLGHIVPSRLFKPNDPCGWIWQSSTTVIMFYSLYVYIVYMALDKWCTLYPTSRHTLRSQTFWHRLNTDPGISAQNRWRMSSQPSRTGGEFKTKNKPVPDYDTKRFL